MASGRCFCGAIEYRTEGRPFDETHCHCSICRRTSGAPFVSWASYPRPSLTVTKGTPSSFRSSNAAVRSFCSACGTPLFFCHDAHPDTIDVTICSLDRPELVRPLDHTWVSSKLPWIELTDALPAHPKARVADSPTRP